MRILVLGPNLNRVNDIIRHHEIEATEAPLDNLVSRFKPDILLSYGYRHLVTRDALNAVQGRAMNMHISLLPWNGGADPNFWSWLQNTPKGVSIHWMSEKFDRGNIVAQSEVALNRLETMSETYEILHTQICNLLAESWADIEAGTAPSVSQPPGGSYHNSADRNPYLSLLSEGWDTPCHVLEDYGLEKGLWRPDGVHSLADT